MATEGTPVPVSKACEWAEISRRTYYYKPKRRKRRVNEYLVQRIRRVIDALPYAGYRTVAWLLVENENTVQRVFQIKGWQVRKRKSGLRPRVQSLPSVA
jgi:putative transposase